MSTIPLPVQNQGFELVTDDGEPMESAWHFLQMVLLIESTHRLFGERTDYYTGGNQFVYYSLDQARAVKQEVEQGRPERQAFRGPDFFLVKGVDGRRERQMWVVWEEDGRYPDLIVELLSPSTRRVDLGPKKELYQNTFRLPEYFCYDPQRDVLQGWRLVKGRFEELPPDAQGRIWSSVLGAFLGRWQGVFHKAEHRWIRLFDEQGRLIGTEKERADAEKERADAEKERADRAEAELARLRAGRDA